ncbi:UNVERIFIED_CONTAM: hypothetical protein FKN15_062133 [Acipenser sinensis]
MTGTQQKHCQGVLLPDTDKGSEPLAGCLCQTAGQEGSGLGSNRVNLVKIPSTVSSPRDTALAAVICSALTTVLLALLILCIIYCKRQLIDKKPSWSVRSQEAPCNGSELLCFDRHRMNTCAHRTCCHCHPDVAQTCAGISENASEELPEKNRHNHRGCQQKSRKIAPLPGFDTGSAL